uniref:Uncharacterized protein n=1 Tax=Manihot esculenta TaxID=3983 RepID=A0A2C9VEE1_MANES
MNSGNKLKVQEPNCNKIEIGRCTRFQLTFIEARGC